MKIEGEEEEEEAVFDSLYSWCEHKVEKVVVFTRENRGGSAQQEEEEEEEEAVCIHDVTNEDTLNTHQAQHRPVQATDAMSE